MQEKKFSRFLYPIGFSLSAPFAIDNYFKYFYGRSCVIKNEAFFLNYGIVSTIILLILLFAYILGAAKVTKKILMIGFFIILAAVLHFFGLNFRKEDEDLSRVVINNLLNGRQEEGLIFSTEALEKKWYSDEEKIVVNFGGCNYYQRRCIYIIKGATKYRINVFLEDPKGVTISHFRG